MVVPDLVRKMTCSATLHVLSGVKLTDAVVEVSSKYISFDAEATTG